MSDMLQLVVPGYNGAKLQGSKKKNSQERGKRK